MLLFFFFLPFQLYTCGLTLQELIFLCIISGCGGEQAWKVEDCDTNDCIDYPPCRQRPQVVAMRSLFPLAYYWHKYIFFDTFIYFFFWRIMQPTRQSCSSWLRCALALHISRTCCMVTCSLHEEDMEDPTKVGARERA